jgi:hypothetical protein
MSIELQNMPRGIMITSLYFDYSDLARYRCLSLLQEHPKRDELLDVLIEAGESAWARGAHEVINHSHTLSDYLP